MKNVVILDGNLQYTNLFTLLGYKHVDEQAVDKGDVDLLVFTGGADVNPALYDHPPHEETSWSLRRDERDASFFKKALCAGTPMVGICRGAQFLNVMNGGAMYQHVVGGTHCRSHVVKTRGRGSTDLVSSTHHQVIMPPDESCVVSVAPFSSTLEWWDDKDQTWMKGDVSDTTEAVVFRENKCLGFQPHPEHFAGVGNHPCINVLIHLMRTELKLTLEV